MADHFGQPWAIKFGRFGLFKTHYGFYGGWVLYKPQLSINFIISF